MARGRPEAGRQGRPRGTVIRVKAAPEAHRACAAVALTRITGSRSRGRLGTWVVAGRARQGAARRFLAPLSETAQRGLERGSRTERSSSNCEVSKSG